MKNILLCLSIAICIFAISVVISCEPQKMPEQVPNNADTTNVVIPEKYKNNGFVPQNGKCFVFIGQDLGAIGGLPNYIDGYCNFFDIPAGVTGYFASNTGGAISGMDILGNWGSGDNFLNKYTENAIFNNTMFAIGFYTAGSEAQIAGGQRDVCLNKIADWLKNIAPRPVFFRIGYEFNNYPNVAAENYIAAFRYIKDYFARKEVHNVVFVWQSTETEMSDAELNCWYPGDEYVDWCAFSYFYKPNQSMTDFARVHNKPVMIAEATPILANSDEFMTNSEQAQKMRDEWFVPFFQFVENNDDVVKAFSYINVDWYSQPMWQGAGNMFSTCDSRIQVSEYVSNFWLQKIAETRYLNAEEINWNDFYIKID